MEKRWAGDEDVEEETIIQAIDRSDGPMIDGG
jgi:hypothetical protein